MAKIDAERQSIIISLKPPYARAILEGSKTIELRRRFMSTVPSDTRLLVYATDPIKQIIGECYVKEVLHLSIDDLWRVSCRDSMISWETFRSYFSGLSEGYGIVLYKPLVYDTPIPLNDMRTRFGLTPPQSYRSVTTGL